MNLKRKKNLFVSFILVILIFTTVSVSKDVSTAQKEQSSSYDLSAYVTSDPLFIDNDSDLAGNSTSGSGTVGDPYVIENLSIVTSEDTGIEILSTTKNFVIRNCFIDANLYGILIYIVAYNTVEVDNNIVYNHEDIGIWIMSTDGANVTNNYCDDNTKGIYMESLDAGVVKNNTCINGDTGITGSSADYVNYIQNNCAYNSNYGIYLDNCDSCTVSENICNYNDYHGIYIYLGFGTSVSFNQVHDNNFNGIIIQTAVNDEVINNTVYANGGVGIYNDRSSNTVIANNSLSYDGFRITMSNILDYTTLTVSNNTVNGKPLGFYYALGEMVLSTDNFGQLMLVGCDGTLVKDITIQDTDYALSLMGCNSVIVDNCDFDNNIGGSVMFEGTVNCTLKNTLCSHNPSKPGIFFGGTMNDVILNCTSSNNYYGLQIVSSTNFTILNSTFNQNIISNAYLTEGAAGNIRYNAFTNAGALGLQFVNIDYVNISHNLFESNTQYAIYLDSESMWNWIHHNAFLGNAVGYGTSQAFDDTMNLNMWDDPWNMEGNYWDDWVSGNYTIDGLGQANDSYPYGSIPPGVFEFSQFTFLVFLIPVVFVSISIIRKRKK